LARLGPWPDSALGPLRSALGPFNSALGPLHALPQEPGPSSRPLPWSPPQDLDWAGLFRPGGGQLAQTRPMARYVCGLAVPLTCRCKLAAAAMHSGRQGARLTKQGPRPGAPDGHCAIPPGSTSSGCHRGLCWWCYPRASCTSGASPPGGGSHWHKEGAVDKTFVQLLAQAPRQGAVHLGVGAGRTISSALGAAEAEAAQVAVNLGTRERLGHKVCWVLCAQHLM
jgi:hypothetical protein